MLLPSFTLFNFLGTVWFILSLFAVAKILTLDWDLHAREAIYFVAAAFVAALISVISRDLYGWVSLGIGDLVMVFSVSLYLRKIKNYSLKKSLILTFFTLYISITVLYFLLLGFHYLILLPGVSFNIDFLPYTGSEVSFYAVQQVFFYMPFFVTPAIFVARLTRKSRFIVSENEKLQNLFMFAGLVQFILFSVLITFWRLQEHEVVETLISGNAIVIASFSVTILLGLYIYAGFVDAKNKREQKETEQRTLQYYTHELEQQHVAIQKFKHDYQNILISMREFIKEEDMAGLKDYFISKIEVVSETITRDSFTLQGLSKIKVREIKSIIAAKIMLAQNTIEDINIKFEANEDIEHIPINSVALVRMLGIVLDNAIEALAELGGGKLLVNCQKWEAGVTFIVENTCKPDIPPLHELLKPGFSTKGKKRGLGLSNLAEIANSYPNVIMKTSISGGCFTQKLLIEDGVEN